MNAVSAIPVLLPRAQLLWQAKDRLHTAFLWTMFRYHQTPTIAKVLKKEGYDTAYNKKWHINNYGESNFIPRERRSLLWLLEPRLNALIIISTQFIMPILQKEMEWLRCLDQTQVDAIQYLKNRKSETAVLFNVIIRATARPLRYSAIGV